MKRKHTEKYILELKNAVALSTNYRQVCTNMDIDATGPTYKRIRQEIAKFQIDTSHFLSSSDLARWVYETYEFGRKLRRSDDAIFCKHSNVDRHTLRARVLEKKVVPYVCQKCGQDDMWYGERITLILDHINGVNNDNRKENLRFVCPNCEGTLPTHCKGARGLVKKPKTIKIKSPRLHKRKMVRPLLSTLLSEVNEMGYKATGRKYGVSDNSIRKWIKSYQVFGV